MTTPGITKRKTGTTNQHNGWTHGKVKTPPGDGTVGHQAVGKTLKLNPQITHGQATLGIHGTTAIIITLTAGVAVGITVQVIGKQVTGLIAQVLGTVLAVGPVVGKTAQVTGKTAIQKHCFLHEKD